MMTPTMTTAKSKVIFDEPGRAADPVLLSYFAPSYVMYEYKFCILSLEHKTLLVLSPIRDLHSCVKPTENPPATPRVALLWRYML